MKKLSLKELNNKWEYRSDELDGWTVTSEGDCDDYALTVAWIAADHSWVKFWWDVATFKTLFYRVKTENGTPHLILRHKSVYIDNRYKQWLIENPYKKIFPFVWLPPFVAVKVFIGRFFK